MINAITDKERLAVTIEDTQIEVIEDLKQHVIDNIAKIVLKNNPKFLLRSLSSILLSGTMEIHPKGFHKHDLNTFSAETWFFFGVNFHELSYRPNADWRMFKTKRVFVKGTTTGMPLFRQNEHIEKLEMANVDLLDKQASMLHSFLSGAKGIRTLVIHDSPSIVLPRNMMEEMKVIRKVNLTLDLPNIGQFSLKSIDMVDFINGVRVINKHKWETAKDSDCRYFCGDPLVDVSKAKTPPDCPQSKNPKTFLCALCLRNRLGEKADFETTKSICGYNSQKSPDYSYDYGYNEATEQSPDFYKSPQNLAYPSYSTIVLIAFHICSQLCCFPYPVRHQCSVVLHSIYSHACRTPSSVQQNSMMSDHV